MGQVKFVTEGSNSTYHREKAYNLIEECEVQSLQRQKELTDMLLVMKQMFYSSHVNVTQHFSPPLLLMYVPPPTTFKGKETALKTPNSQKKRKLDDNDTDYDPEVVENLSTPTTTKIVTRKNINDEKEPISIPLLIYSNL
ncbi:hypothetical protein ACTFIU_000998 [Dictyostelium citrinum]